MCVRHSAHLELGHQEVILSLAFLLCVIQMHLCRSLRIWSAASNYCIVLRGLWLLLLPVSPPSNRHPGGLPFPGTANSTVVSILR